MLYPILLAKLRNPLSKPPPANLYKKDLKLSDRIYKCECGNVIDRDYQASLNLKRYGEIVLEQQSVV